MQGFGPGIVGASPDLFSRMAIFGPGWDQTPLHQPCTLRIIPADYRDQRIAKGAVEIIEIKIIQGRCIHREPVFDGLPG